ncbi:hypothetical protein XU18_1865 [Perkinsela sp. CCAP 1560/4]|nr:hypothetical protein XU18_1865 [Perkinsela sp. CCAP 1560/4]|eukprot:KNH07333.1 hypothetical protein XU18_1865 [Perkinsela sp. CCAP 1560/4]
MLGRTPKDTIAARLLVSQINDELRQLSEKERRSFFHDFPEINEKLQRIDNFRRISECYPQSIEAQIEEPHCISPFEEWASYGAGNFQRPYQPTFSSSSGISSASQVSVVPFDGIQTNLPGKRSHDDQRHFITNRPYSSPDADLLAIVQLSSSWKKMDTLMESHLVALEATPKAETAFSQEYRDSVKKIILTGKLPGRVDGGSTTTAHSSPKARRKKSRQANHRKQQRNDSIRSMLRDARESKAAEQKKPS